MTKMIEWISHRGLSTDAQENTLEAFKAAYHCGFRHFETDLRLSKDGHIVLHHDPCLKFDGSDANLSDLSLAELKSISYKKPGHTTTLKELLLEFPHVKLIFDVKKESDIAVLKKLQVELSELGQLDRLISGVRFLFWTKRASKLADQIFPDTIQLATKPECIVAGLYSLTKFVPLKAFLRKTSYAVTPNFLGIKLFSSRTSNFYHEKLSSKTIAYLPKKVEDIKEAIDAKFDEILTDGKILKF